MSELDAQEAKQIVESASQTALLTGFANFQANIRQFNMRGGFAPLLSVNKDIINALDRKLIASNDDVNAARFKDLNSRIKKLQEGIEDFVALGTVEIKTLTSKQRALIKDVTGLIKAMAEVYPKVESHSSNDALPGHLKQTLTFASSLSKRLNTEIGVAIEYDAQKMIRGDYLARVAKEPGSLAWSARVRNWVAGTALLGSLGVGSQTAYQYVEKNITDPARALAMQLESNTKETPSSEGVLLKRRNLTRTQKENNKLKTEITEADTKISTIADKAENIEGVFDVLATLLAMSASLGALGTLAQARKDGEKREESWQENIKAQAKEINRSKDRGI